MSAFLTRLSCNACDALCSADQHHRGGLGYCADCFAQVAGVAHNDGFFAAHANLPLQPDWPEAKQAGWYAQGAEQLTPDQLREAAQAVLRG